MNRRTSLKLGALSGSVLAVPTLMSSFLSKKREINDTVSNGHIRIALDGVEVMIFSDGHLFMQNPQPIFAPDIPSSHFSKALENLYIKKGELDLALNVMMIKTGGKTILIDAGSGNHFRENEGWLLKNIESAGINASSITDIFITHAHRDHIGGLVTKDNTMVYPNAQYHMAKTEYDFWMSDNPDFSKSRINPQQKEASINFTQRILNAIKEKVRFFDYGDTLFSCLKTALAEGHTPGHTIFTISSGNKSVKGIVDTFHSPLLIRKPEWGTQWDTDFEQGIKTRKSVLEDCFKNRQLTMSSHLPWPGLGFIGKEKDYYWVPLSYATPNEIHL